MGTVCPSVVVAVTIRAALGYIRNGLLVSILGMYHRDGLPLLTGTTTSKGSDMNATTSHTCQHFGCARAATDERRGWKFCLGHFFTVLQWEQARPDVAA